MRLVLARVINIDYRCGLRTIGLVRKAVAIKMSSLETIQGSFLSNSAEISVLDEYYKSFSPDYRVCGIIDSLNRLCRAKN